MEQEKVNFEEVANRVKSILDRELTEIDLYIMKCHLIVEREMILFLEYLCKHPLKKPFQFHVLFRMVNELYDGFNVPGWAKKDDVETFVELLADLRNGIAHSFRYEKGKMDKAMGVAVKFAASNEQKPHIPFVGMFNGALTTISITFILKSGRGVFAKREEPPKDVV